MFEDFRHKYGAKTFGVVALNVVLALVINALGTPGLIAITVAILGTALLGLWVFRPPVWMAAVAVLAPVILLGIAVKRDVFYDVEYDFCRAQTLELVQQELRVSTYEFGIRPLNFSDHKLYSRLDEFSLIVAGKPAPTPPLNATKPFAKNSLRYAISSAVRFSPSIPMSKVDRAKLRLVMSYGRNKDYLDKKLVVSGELAISWLQNGDTRFDFDPQGDTEMPREAEVNCHFPPPSGSKLQAAVVG